jgi:protein-arginine kinase activator protein McsA
MKNYIVLLQDIENLLRTLSEQKAEDIRTQHYQAAGLVRDQERKILDDAKELLMEMKVDIEGLPPDSSEKLELMKVFQNYMEDFGFDNTKRIEALNNRNHEIDIAIEAFKNEKSSYLKAEQFTEANRVRDKIILLQEEYAKNIREIRVMQGF